MMPNILVTKHLELLMAPGEYFSMYVNYKIPKKSLTVDLFSSTYNRELNFENVRLAKPLRYL